MKLSLERRAALCLLSFAMLQSAACSASPGVPGGDALPAANLRLALGRVVQSEASARALAQRTISELQALAATTGPCPRVTVQGNTQTFTGGCVDARGFTVLGDAVLETGSDGSLHATYRAYGLGYTNRDEDGCRLLEREFKDGSYFWSPATGVFSLDEHRVKESQFACHLAPVTSTRVASYDGTAHATGGLYDHSDGPEQGVWSGTGLVGDSFMGLFWTTTFTQRIDPSSCASEPVSGVLELRSGSERVQLLFDGATSCQPVRPSVPWTDDGVVQPGELPVQRCT